MAICIKDELRDELTKLINKSLDDEKLQKSKSNSIYSEIQNKKNIKRQVTPNNLFKSLGKSLLFSSIIILILELLINYFIVLIPWLKLIEINAAFSIMGMATFGSDDIKNFRIKRNANNINIEIEKLYKEYSDELSILKEYEVNTKHLRKLQKRLDNLDEKRKSSYQDIAKLGEEIHHYSKTKKLNLY